MKLTSRLLASAAFATALVVSASASAAPLFVSYTPVTDDQGAFSFNIDSNPTPISSLDGDNFDASVTNATGQYSGFNDVQFYNTAPGGGLGDYFGEQLYSGSESAPTILTGTYFVAYGSTDNLFAAGLLTIAAAAPTNTGAVPEPATWAMMLSGFGMIGFGLRYRRKSTTVRFA